MGWLLPGVMKVDCAFKAGTIVAEVGFVHWTAVRAGEKSDRKLAGINKNVTRTDELLI
ncbi:hypothetical protein H098_22345 [Pseudomonas fluorescens FH5]|nr:hypothetical protein CF150_06435 [Pseudomonas sp. CF150]ETK39466.1 hypothetical protein H098_22345 [Pseudomonas fluorescens FH5]